MFQAIVASPFLRSAVRTALKDGASMKMEDLEILLSNPLMKSELEKSLSDPTYFSDGGTRVGAYINANKKHILTNMMIIAAIDKLEASPDLNTRME